MHGKIEQIQKIPATTYKWVYKILASWVDIFSLSHTPI